MNQTVITINGRSGRQEFSFATAGHVHCHTYDINDNLLIDEQFRNGLPAGEYRKLRPDGTPNVVKQFDNQTGLLNGMHEVFNKNGGYITRCEYVQGVPEGMRYEYHPDGKTVKNTIPLHKGEKHGTVYVTYPNGWRESTTPYTHGVRQGQAMEYHPNHRLKSTVVYIDDKPVNKRTEFYDNDIVEREIFYGEPGVVIGENGYYKDAKPHYRRRLFDGIPSYQVEVSFDPEGRTTKEEMIRGAVRTDITQLKATLLLFQGAKKDMLPFLFSTAEEDLSHCLMTVLNTPVCKPHVL